ncbi:hypothetical protein [Burkholderia cepacia]|uniref:hypothetical protein n=1 Tax=Burkholderia cepacia TaxID=292 RepID=UPI002AB75A12|nr:hypothetical protein [Burkholderia cepacia]
MIDFSNPSVQAAIINAFATTICAISVALVGKQIAWSKQQREQLKVATDDIAFLLAVELAHCELHKATGGVSNKLRVRREVETTGLRFSGRFTPGRVSGVQPSQLQLLLWRRHRSTVDALHATSAADRSKDTRDVTHEKTVFREVLVQLDDSAEVFRAYSNGARYNGGIIPYFSKEEADRLAKVQGELSFDAKHNSFVWHPHDGTKDDSEVYVGVSIEVAGRVIEVYGIGAGSWSWY